MGGNKAGEGGIRVVYRCTSELPAAVYVAERPLDFHAISQLVL